jgi:CheY-like chemotaxis protein
VLIVADEPEIRWALCAALEDRGYTATTVASGEEAVASVEQSQPEVILLDLSMPGMGGLEACTRIRARWSVPIIVLSVMGEEQDKVAALDAGVDDFLIMPDSIDKWLVGSHHNGAPRSRSPTASVPARPTDGSSIGSQALHIGSRAGTMAGPTRTSGLGTKNVRAWWQS